MTFVRMTEKNQNDVFSNYRKVEISAIKHVYRLSVQSFSINLIDDLCHNGLKKNQGFKNKLMFDSSLNTYAISLHFPQDVNQMISSAVNSIAVATGNSFIIEKNIPPHITIGAFHASKNDESKLISIVEEFSKNQKFGTIQFKEIGNFKKKVLFLKPEKNAFLSQINSELHLLMLSEFENAENGYYLPKI